MRVDGDNNVVRHDTKGFFLEGGLKHKGRTKTREMEVGRGKGETNEKDCQ